MTTELKYDVIVIGAGISGLSAAKQFSDLGKKVLLLEKEERTGGCVQTVYHEDFFLELGAHTAYNSYEKFLELLKTSDLKNNFLKREKQSYKISKAQKLESIFSQLNFLELLGHLPNALFCKKKNFSVEEYYSKVTGKSNFKKLLKPMFDAVISQESNDFPADLLLNTKSKRDASYPRSFTFKKGISEYVEMLKSADFELITSTTVKELKKKGRDYYISVAGSMYTCSTLILACPPQNAGDLLNSASPSLSLTLKKIKQSTVNSVGIICKKEALSLETFAGIIPKDDIYFSITSRDLVFNDKYRGFTIHFSNDYTKEQAFAKLIEILGIQEKAIEKKCFRKHTLPSLTSEHHELIAKVKELLEKEEGLGLTGNYFTGTSIEHCVSRSLSEVERLNLD